LEGNEEKEGALVSCSASRGYTAEVRWSGMLVASSISSMHVKLPKAWNSLVSVSDQINMSKSCSPILCASNRVEKLQCRGMNLENRQNCLPSLLNSTLSFGRMFLQV